MARAASELVGASAGGGGQGGLETSSSPLAAARSAHPRRRSVRQQFVKCLSVLDNRPASPALLEVTAGRRYIVKVIQTTEMIVGEEKEKRSFGLVGYADKESYYIFQHSSCSHWNVATVRTKRPLRIRARRRPDAAAAAPPPQSLLASRSGVPVVPCNKSTSACWKFGDVLKGGSGAEVQPAWARGPARCAPPSPRLASPPPRAMETDVSHEYQEYLNEYFLRETNSLDQYLDEIEESSSRSCDEGEQEAEWLVEAGLPQLSEAFAEGREVADAELEPALRSLPRHQAEAVKRRVRTLNHTLRRRHHAPPPALAHAHAH
ncbi:Rho GTPase-activating protein conundrum, partial [Gryllus bimaculatus]